MNWDSVMNFIEQTGFYQMGHNFIAGGTWKFLVMILISFLLLWLAIKKQFEPLLLTGIAFGMLLTNLTGFFPNDPSVAMYHSDMWLDFMNEASPNYHSYGYILANGGFLDFLFEGDK